MNECGRVVQPLILKISAKGRARGARAAETQRRREAAQAAQETKQYEKDNPQKTVVALSTGRNAQRVKL